MIPPTIRGNNPLLLTVVLLRVLRFYPLVPLLDGGTTPCKMMEAQKKYNLEREAYKKHPPLRDEEHLWSLEQWLGTTVLINPKSLLHSNSFISTPQLVNFYHFLIANQDMTHLFKI